MLLVAVVSQIICGGKFLVAFYTFEMNRLLMLVQNDFVGKYFIAVKTEGFNVVQTSLNSAHNINNNQLIKFT